MFFVLRSQKLPTSSPTITRVGLTEKEHKLMKKKWSGATNRMQNGDHQKRGFVERAKYVLLQYP